MRHTLLITILALLVSVSACGQKVDVSKELQVVDLTTGWFDAGIVKTPDGDMNKIVPSVAFKLKNTASGSISTVQVLVVYHQVTEPTHEWGTSWVKGIGSEGLNPGQTSRELVLRSDLGYTGQQPRMQMLQNRNFVDAFADILVKQGADKYVKLASPKIDRQLLTQ